MSAHALSDFFDEGCDLTDPVLYAGPDGAMLLPDLAFRSAVFAAMEDERIWTPCWVCIGSEADIPEIGDLLPYTVGVQTVHVQRQADNSLVARYNKAQHGGCRFVPLQCQTGTKTRCSFTSCGYSRDRGPIKGASLIGTTPEAYQYLGMRPERLPKVPLAQVGPLLFVNLDPAGALGAPIAAQPQIPTGVLPPQGTPRTASRWVEIGANWKRVAEILASGDAMSEAGDGAWMHTRSRRSDSTMLEVISAFPNLIIWCSPTAQCVMVLQPLAISRTLCRVSLFVDGSNADEEAERTIEHLQALTTLLEFGDVMRSGLTYGDTQSVRHVLTRRHGYQPMPTRV